MKKTFLLLLLASLMMIGKAQSKKQWKYIYTLKIDSVTTPAQAKYATTTLRKISHTMRVDFNHSTYYFTIKSNADVSKSDFINGLQQAGYDVSGGIHFSETYGKASTNNHINKSNK